MKTLATFLAILCCLLVANVSYAQIDSFLDVQAENYSSQQGVKIVGGNSVGFIENGDWIGFENVDFGYPDTGNGATGLTVRASSNTNGGTIELRLGSPTGSLVGTVPITGTGGWSNFEFFEATLPREIGGVDDLYLVFKGDQGYLLDIDRFVFSGDEIDATSIEIAGCPEALAVGETYTLDVTILPTNTTNKNLAFYTSNSSVASVDYLSGEIEALSPGTATISVTSFSDGGLSDECIVEVVPEGSTPPITNPNPPAPSTAGTEAWWEHVASLEQKGVTGTSGTPVRYGSPRGQEILEGTPFEGKRDGDNVYIDSDHDFYDIDFRNLRVHVRSGAEVSFYNCKFGEDGTDFDFTGAASGYLIAEGTETTLKLRFCDFQGPGNGKGWGAMLLAHAVRMKDGKVVGEKGAYIDAAYCRTWGQKSDSWKIARGVTRFSYFDPSVATEKKPVVWEEGLTYQPGDYVVAPDDKFPDHTAHVWQVRSQRETSQQPRFDLKGQDGIDHNKTANDDWKYINPHADAFHIFLGRYKLLAEGHFINQRGDEAAVPFRGASLGVNNAFRRADGDFRPNQGVDTIRGCLIKRSQQQSNAIHSTLNQGEDSKVLRVEHLRFAGISSKVIYASPSVRFHDLQDLDGQPLKLQPESHENKDMTEATNRSEAYFAGTPPEAPTLTVASRWRVRPTKFAPAYDKNDSLVNAVVYYARGKRVAYLTEDGVTFDARGYKFEPTGNGEYELYSEDGSDFHLIVWRGESPAEPAGTAPNNTGSSGQADRIEVVEFSRNKAPFDAQLEQNEARVPFVVAAKNGEAPAPGVVIEARVVTDGAEPAAVATWTERGQANQASPGWQLLGTTDSQGRVTGNLYTARHPKYLQREVRIQNNDQVADASEHSFGVGHTIMVFAQSNVDQGFKANHQQTRKPDPASVDMVQHYYHQRENGAVDKIGPEYIRRWDTGVDDEQDVTGWPTAFANALAQSVPNEKFFVVWHVHSGTDYIDMVNQGGKRVAAADKALADFVYADGQDRGGIAGGAWTHTPGVTGQFFEEAHFPIFFGKTPNGEAVPVPSKVKYGFVDKETQETNQSYDLTQWIGGWSQDEDQDQGLYELDYLHYALQDPHQFAPRDDIFRMITATTGNIKRDGTFGDTEEKIGWLTSRNDSRASIRAMVNNQYATNARGESIMLPIYMGILNYSIGELASDGEGFTDVTHPSDDTPDGGILFNKLLAHGFLRAADLTDWPEPVFDLHYRSPEGQWWEWYSSAGDITTTRQIRGEERPTLPEGASTAHWTEVVGFQIDGKPATRVELIDGRVRIYAPEGDPFGPDDLSRISHGDGGASGQLNNQADQVVGELWKDIAVVDFDLPGLDDTGVALRAQLPPTQVGQPATETSAPDTGGGSAPLVSVGDQGELIYQKYANEGQTNEVNTVPDFSRAGYRGGGVAIPTVPVKMTVDPAPGDDQTRIQAAVDQVSAMEPDANGFRGAVLLTKGVYEVARTIKITASGVVLRGEGQSGDGTRIVATGTEQDTLILVRGSSEGHQRIESSIQTITDDYVPVGSRQLTIESAADYQVGDQIVVERTPNQQWIDDIGMTDQQWKPERFVVGYDRTITAIDGDTLTLDAPMVQALEERYGGGQVYRYSFPGRVANVGVEQLRLESTYASETDENHAWRAVLLAGAEHSWVRKVTMLYFGGSGVSVGPIGYNRRLNSRFVTVEDCAMLDPKSKIEGGKRYSFTVRGGGEFVLFQRCYTRGGRHDYVTTSRVAGPNVFLDCYATEANNDIGPHFEYATGLLFDNILGGMTRVWDRTLLGVPNLNHGWAGAQTMFWNCESRAELSNINRADGADFRVDSPPGARNWGIGVVGNRQLGEGYWESYGQPVLPRSLYLAQLEARLGRQAVEAVTTPEQRDGRIWDYLATWAGGEATIAVDFPNPGKWYRIYNEKHPDRGLRDTDQAYEEIGNYVATLPYEGDSSEQWRFIPQEDGYYRIVSQKHPDRALHDANEAYQEVGNYVITHPYNPRYSSQKWQLVGNNSDSYRIVSRKHPNRGLRDTDQTYEEVGNYVATLPYQGDSADKWYLEEVGDVNARVATADKSPGEASETTGGLGTPTIYPNPVRDVLHIRQPANAPEGEAYLEVYNLQGQRMLRQRVTDTEAEVDVRALRAGTYLLRWVRQDQVVPSVLVKE